jgi:pyrroloquinoline quinone (PQQ) biosynthesis protein C
MGAMHELSPQPPWVGVLNEFVHPYWSALVSGDFAAGAATTRLSLEELRGWMLQMYPFIHTFPKFLAEALIKVEDDYSRSFLIDNIRVEKAHAEHWLWMAEGFGLQRRDLLDMATGERATLRDVQSLTDWLWYINTKGSLPEAVAATSYAIEGVTGDLTRKTLAGFEAYGQFPGVVMNARTTRWMRTHARYDDQHPKLALEVITRYANNERIQRKVMLAARRSLQLLDLAFNAAYRAYSPAPRVSLPVVVDMRAAERRRAPALIGFPERRLMERRGSGGYRIA